MYVRIARFEGADVSRVEQDAEEIRRQMQAAEPPESMPADVFATLQQGIARMIMLVDRSSGTTVDLVFTRDQTSLEQVDAALSSLTPPDGMGRRTGVEMYEVVLDESVG
jgi:hypothetical protein